MPKMTSSVAYLLLALCFFLAAPCLASDDEVWMASAKREAERDGYKLIDTKGLAKLIDSGAEVLIIDARADYEFKAGHIPRSTNLEFDLGDKVGLSDEKKTVYKELLGSDKKRKLVLYCRSFR